MKAIYERDTLMENIHAAINHSKEFDLPLASIELTEMEWRLFFNDSAMRNIYPRYETMTERWCRYMGVLIYQEGYKPKE